MYITGALTALKLFKKFWWVLPLIGIGIYIFILNTKISSLENDIKDKDQIISIQKQEIEFNKKTIENQKKKIEALEEQAERNKDIEKKYKEEKKKNKEIIEKYKKDKNTKDIMKRIEGLLPKKEKKDVK